jgi:LysR family glycine cleavage system transcriptional activator
MSLRAAAVGLGVALVPEHDLADELSARRLVVPIAHRCPSDRAYYLAIPQHKTANPLLAAFRDWLLTQAGRAGRAVEGASR